MEWIEKRDKVNKLFFKKWGPTNSKFQVRCLRHQDGTLALEPDDIRMVATNFYTKLLSSTTLSSSDWESRHHVWDAIQVRVSPYMHDFLAMPFSEDELFEALRKLPVECCAGEDGLSRDFFMMHWHIISRDLAQAFNEMF